MIINRIYETQNILSLPSKSRPIASWRKFEPTPRVSAAGAQRVQESKMVAHGFDTNRILKSSMFGANHLRRLLITPTLTNYDWHTCHGCSLSYRIIRHYTQTQASAVLFVDRRLKIHFKTKSLNWYDIFINCNCVVTRWQQYSTHLHTNSTQNDTKQTIHRTT